MPRTLPWLVQEAKKQETKRLVASSSPAPRQRKRASTPDDLVDEDLNTTGLVTPKRRENRRQARSPSTSPPPAPPDVEFMREGYSADDIWMMVEDEFYSTAQMFTQHIHHAAYVELKKQAKAKGAGTLQTIARPTDGRTAQSAGLKLMKEAKATARNIKEGLAGMNGRADSDGEEEDEYMRDPQLAGLMTGSQRTGQELTGFGKAKSNTRAAAGFTKSPQKARRTRDAEENARLVKKGTKGKQQKPQKQPKQADWFDSSEDDEEDPDTMLIKREKPEPAFSGAELEPGSEEEKSVSFFERSAKPSAKQSRRDRGGEASSSRREVVKREKLSPEKTIKVEPSRFEDSDEDTRIAPVRPQPASDYLAKRRAAREKREREEKRKGRSPAKDVEIATWV